MGEGVFGKQLGKCRLVQVLFNGGNVVREKWGSLTIRITGNHLGANLYKQLPWGLHAAFVAGLYHRTEMYSPLGKRKRE